MALNVVGTLRGRPTSAVERGLLWEQHSGRRYQQECTSNDEDQSLADNFVPVSPAAIASFRTFVDMILASPTSSVEDGSAVANRTAHLLDFAGRMLAGRARLGKGTEVLHLMYFTTEESLQNAEWNVRLSDGLTESADVVHSVFVPAAGNDSFEWN